MYFRADPVNVELTGNRISSVPLTSRAWLLDGGKYATLTGPVSPLLESARPCRHRGPSDRAGASSGWTWCSPMLTPDHLKGVPAYTTNAAPKEDGVDGTDRVLIGAVEIVVRASYRPGPEGNFQLPVRVAFQPTPRAGVAGTVPWPDAAWAWRFFRAA